MRSYSIVLSTEGVFEEYLGSHNNLVLIAMYSILDPGLQGRS